MIFFLNDDTVDRLTKECCRPTTTTTTICKHCFWRRAIDPRAAKSSLGRANFLFGLWIKSSPMLVLRSCRTARPKAVPICARRKSQDDDGGDDCYRRSIDRLTAVSGDKVCAGVLNQAPPRGIRKGWERGPWAFRGNSVLSCQPRDGRVSQSASQ